MPAISSGIFGFPKDRCAKILLNESRNFLTSSDISIEIVEFCIFDDETLRYFKTEFSNSLNSKKELNPIADLTSGKFKLLIPFSVG